MFLKGLSRQLLFYTPSLVNNTTEVRLQEEEAHHALHVLRLKEGQKVTLFNGLGGYSEGVIKQAEKNKKYCLVQIQSFFQTKNNLEPSVSIAIGVIKQSERWRFLVEKLTELGVNRIIPLNTDYTQVKHLNLDKTKRYAIGAAKQSGQLFLPKIDPLSELKEVLEYNCFDARFVAEMHETAFGEVVSELKNTVKNMLFIVGPEGGFSDKEKTYFSKYKISAVQLGNNRLRTETAAIMIMSCINAFVYE